MGYQSLWNRECSVVKNEERDMKVYIWGIGRCTEAYLSKGELQDEQIIGYIQSERSQNTYRNKKVYEPHEIEKNIYDYILVLIYSDTRAVIETCKKLKLPLDRIVVFDAYEWFDGTTGRKIPEKLCHKIFHNPPYEKLNKLFPRLAEEIDVREREVLQYIVTLKNAGDFIDGDNFLEDAAFSAYPYKCDYLRFRTFELMADRIIEENVQGEVAELGVFQGIFARLINKKFKDRKLYLFDTFDSFDYEEFCREVEMGNCPEGFYEAFKSTSETQVLKRMPFPNQCVVCKGFFPNTTEKLEELRFAFVSIDVDFKKSIYEGLKYFYPRMNVGGAIFVHDYHNYILQGVKQGIEKYESELGYCLKALPLADEGGTLVIIK